jgi:integrase
MEIRLEIKSKSAPLTDSKIKSFEPKEAAYKKFDGGGLYLVVNPSGSKFWRLSYRFNGKQQTASFGSYKDVSLKEAREKASQLKKELAKELNPALLRKDRKLAQQNDFKFVALEWHKSWSKNLDKKHVQKVLRRLEADVFPEIGSTPVSAITAPMIIRMAKKIAKREAYDIAKRAFATCSQILRFAKAHGLCEWDVTRDISLSDAHIESPPVTHRAALKIEEVPALLREINEYDKPKYNGSTVTKLAILLLAHTFVRTTELIEARWNEFDFDNSTWTIPAERMKKVKGRAPLPHIVHLSKQSIEILGQLKNITGGRKFLFPHQSNINKTMSNNTILHALERMGYKYRMTGHGFRSIASTQLHEMGYAHDHIEAQLSHLQQDKVSKAYNHALYLIPRATLLNDWSSFLHSLTDNSNVIGIKRAANA